MNQKKAANNDIIKAVSGNVIAYPLMFFACGMTVRALAKGLSSCIKGGKKPIQTWFDHKSDPIKHESHPESSKIIRTHSIFRILKKFINC